jgi:CRISPR/Cas system-associated protein Cas7 (RAMP superfamily)
MKTKIIKLTESDLTRIVKRVIKEQTEGYNFNRGLQCFLNKKGFRDDDGNMLKLDGSIGNYPKSKSAQAIFKYQDTIGVVPDDVFGVQILWIRCQKEIKKVFKECISDYGDIFDKGAHWLGID